MKLEAVEYSKAMKAKEAILYLAEAYAQAWAARRESYGKVADLGRACGPEADITKSEMARFEILDLRADTLWGALQARVQEVAS